MASAMRNHSVHEAVVKSRSNPPPRIHLMTVQIVSKMKNGKTMSVRICLSAREFGGPDFAK